MAEHHIKPSYESEAAPVRDDHQGGVETKDRGLFDFLGKKEDKKPQEEALVSEFEKVSVSEPKPKVDQGYYKDEPKVDQGYYKDEPKFDQGYHKEEPKPKVEGYYKEEPKVEGYYKEEPKVEEYYKKDEEKDKKEQHGLLGKLHRSGSSSSSSSDEEGDDEEKKRRRRERKERKEKKGHTLKEKIAGEKEEEKHVKYEEKHEKYEDTSVPVHVEKYEEEVAHVPAEPAVLPEEKKGFLDKIKEKLPGSHKKAEEGPLSPQTPPPTSTDYAATAPPPYEGEAKEKKGILEKIKEKIPGYHPKTEEEKEKEKEKQSGY